MSKHILFAKLIYGCFVNFQFFKGTIGFQRNIIYQLALLAHYITIKMQETNPYYFKFHASLSMLLFCSFTINDQTAFPDGPTESMALMIGCCSAFYLASAFLTYQWIYFMVGNVTSTILIIFYFVNEFGLSMYSLAPSLIISSITCCSVAYFVELHDKKQFLDKMKIKGL